MLQQLLSQDHLVWLVIGLLSLPMGMLIGEPSIIALSIAALVTAIIALTTTSAFVQVILWGILALCLAIIMRGLEPRESQSLAPPTDAEVSEPIPSGGMGYVFYDGSLWQARCQISDVSIAAGSAVSVVGRHGNTLIVLPVPHLSTEAG